MKTFTIDDVNKWNPCYDPIKYLEPGKKYTVLSILDDRRIPFADRLWCICRDDLLSDKLMRLFAVRCARQVQHLMKDERSINALDVAERFAHGEATKEELDAAKDAAKDAAWAAAWAAALSTARSAARDAAKDAAWAAAWAAALSTAWDATQESQETKLREMILDGIKSGDVK